MQKDISNRASMLEDKTVKVDDRWTEVWRFGPQSEDWKKWII